MTAPPSRASPVGPGGIPGRPWSCLISHSRRGVLKPGDALPSVRQVAAEYQLNPITVSRAYQELADEALVEKRRGLGMYVTEEAARKLLINERERFLREEWPLVLERIQRLGLTTEELLRAGNKDGGQ